MPVLLQINECLNYSTGKIAQQIGELALSKGWESLIAYSGREESLPSKSNCIRVGTYTDACFHFICQRLFDNEGLNSRRYTKQLIRRIDEIGPDIIQLHNIHDHWLNYELLFEYLGKTNIPVVWTQHDCWAFTGGCMYYDLLNCERWKNDCDGCTDKRSILNKASRNLSKKVNAINKIKNLTFVPVSDWLAEALKQSRLSKYRIVTIHNGIDINVFNPSTGLKSINTFKVLGVAAVWDERKGLDDFILLRSSLPVGEYSITLVGLTRKQIKGLPDGIRGIERTQNVEELVALYSEADVFVNLTYSDNFPTTNIEALACGTPVITYNTGGSPEAIDKGTGIVVECGNITDLVDSIKSLKNNPLDSSTCRRRAEEFFDRNKCFENYFHLYNQILGIK